MFNLVSINKFQRSTFNLVSINKFQRSRLTFDLSAKVAHSAYLNIVISETTKPIGLTFHMSTPYDWLVKMCTNCYGHMAATPIYGKKYLNIFFSGTKTPMALRLTI